MAIILQGDRAKAATWVPWAKNQLQRLKIFRSVVNQIYRPAGGVGIHVRSGAGIDWIRIVAIRIIGCRNDFVQLEPFFPGSFNIDLTNSHWVDNKRVQRHTLDFWGWYLYGDSQAQFIGNVEGLREHIYPNAGDFDVTLYSFFPDRRINNGVINLTSFNITPFEAIFIINTSGTTKALGNLSLLLDGSRTITDITITIDGEPVEITTHPGTPTRSINIISPKATGGIMTAVVTHLNPTPPWTGWIVLNSGNWAFLKYKCLATRTKTITVT